MAKAEGSWTRHKVALASDHAGFPLKKALVEYLEGEGVECVDVGTHSTASTDYPYWAAKACKLVLEGKCDRAVLVCGTGIGMALAANKLRGIRAAKCQDEYSAECAREHNDANVVTLGARVTGRGLACAVVKKFLEAEFTGAARHVRRLKKVELLGEQRLAELTEREADE